MLASTKGAGRFCAKMSHLIPAYSLCPRPRGGTVSPRPVVAYALLLVAFCKLRAISTEAATATTTDTPTVVWSTAPTTTPSISAKVREYKTWGDIVVVCVMSLATMAVFMTIYELGRRQRGLREIFDRKRETRPGRTPPQASDR